MDINKNNILKEYKTYLDISYSNEKTRELYFKHAISFLNKYEESIGQEPQQIDQQMINTYLATLSNRRNANPFYKGFIKSFVDCFDPDRNVLKLRILKDKSRKGNKIDEYDFLTKDQVTKLINGTSEYISLTLRIYFDTGLRKMELINMDLNKSEWDLDLVNRRMRGVGKGNKEFLVHFSDATAYKIYEWIKKCKNPNKPFLIYKTNTKPYKNQAKQYWYELRRESKALGIVLPNGRDIHPHALRHSLGRYLRKEKQWDIVQVAKKLRHSDINITKRYADATMEEIENKEDKEVFNDR